MLATATAFICDALLDAQTHHLPGEWTSGTLMLKQAPSVARAMGHFLQLISWRGFTIFMCYLIKQT